MFLTLYPYSTFTSTNEFLFDCATSCFSFVFETGTLSFGTSDFSFACVTRTFSFVSEAGTFSFDSSFSFASGISKFSLGLELGESFRLDIGNISMGFGVSSVLTVLPILFGGQYLKIDRPKMFFEGRGPLRIRNLNQKKTYCKKNKIR